MSYYYEYDFTSPDTTFALVKEEFKSYFNTGAVDDVLFNTWTKDCLNKLGKSSYSIEDAVLNICDFWAKLPPDYLSVREAFGCFNTHAWIMEPNAYYGTITTKLDNPAKCTGTPDVIIEPYKEQRGREISVTHTHLLVPGNASTRSKCKGYLRDPGFENGDTFVVENKNRFTTNFREGEVHIKYYALLLDEEGYPMIPDNYRIIKFIECYLKMKVMELLGNQVIDETSKQIEGKYDRYKKAHDIAWVMADIEIKKQTVYQKNMAIKRDLNRNLMYEISDSNRVYRRY